MNFACFFEALKRIAVGETKVQIDELKQKNRRLKSQFNEIEDKGKGSKIQKQLKEANEKISELEKASKF